VLLSYKAETAGKNCKERKEIFCETSAAGEVLLLTFAARVALVGRQTRQE